MPHLTFPCTKSHHLTPGWYLLKGTFMGKPLPVQVFRLDSRTSTQAFGEIFYNALGRRRQAACLLLADVNIPEHGKTDLHLERISEAALRKSWGDEIWADVAQDVQRDLGLRSE